MLINLGTAFKKVLNLYSDTSATAAYSAWKTDVEALAPEVYDQLVWDNVLLFGLDMIAARQDSEEILYAHEIFHVLHAALLGNSSEWSEHAQLTFPLWLEGLATFASTVINPNYSMKDYLMSAELAAISQEDLRGLANQFLSDASAAQTRREVSMNKNTHDFLSSSRANLNEIFQSIFLQEIF